LDGGTIIGGTKEPNDYNPNASLETRLLVLERAAKMYPQILNKNGEFEVIRDVVGQRPSRTRGMRLEIEKVKGTHNGQIVHAYGAGGRGFEICWGVAEEVVAMVTGNDTKTEESRSQIVQAIAKL
jgi:D-amino-acid oxidase